ncbi:MAG: BACON domain-containing protein [Alistipes sp.]|nr:BACON domain-containing protein [Alistipes sp.]
MRRLKLSTLSVLFLSLMVAVACNENPPVEEQPTTAVELAQTYLDVAAGGGDYAVNYTITNPIAGIDIVATADVDWVTDLKAENGTLRFKAAENQLNEERTAIITVKYPAIDNVYLELKQAGFDGVTFQMDITNKTTTTCTSKVIPSDPETPYIIYMAELDYFYNMGIATAEDLFIDDYNYFMGMAEQYDVALLEEFLLMNQIAFKGESVISWTNMTPDKEYVLYAYAIEINDDNSDYSLASPIAYTMFSLSSSELSEVEFDVQIEVNGPEATYNINPINYDGKYYLDIFEEGDYMYRSEGSVLDQSYARTIANTWMSMISIYMQSGYTPEQLLEIMCLQGEETYSEVRNSATNYAMVIYAIEMVDGLPQVASMPQLINFRTEAVEASDMILDIKVENNYVRVADITVTPSTDEPYTIALVAKEEVPTGTDQEITSWLLDNFDMSLYRGSIFSHVNSLKPQSEYSILAFGYYGGTITTKLFRLDFTTEAEGECQNSIVGVRWDGPFSLIELEARFPDKYYNYSMFESMGWYAMWSEIETTEYTQDAFFTIYRADRYTFEGQEAIFNDLVTYTTAQKKLLTGESGVLYVICAVIMDYKGNYSPMWVSEPFMYEYSAETKKPLEEIIEKLGIESEPQAAALSLQPKRR